MYVNKITSVPVNRKTYNDMREKKRASGATERETGRERERERETDRQTDRERGEEGVDSVLFSIV